MTLEKWSMFMNYARACNPYSGFSAPVNETSAIGRAEKAIFSGFPGMLHIIGFVSKTVGR